MINQTVFRDHFVGQKKTVYHLGGGGGGGRARTPATTCLDFITRRFEPHNNFVKRSSPLLLALETDKNTHLDG